MSLTHMSGFGLRDPHFHHHYSHQQNNSHYSCLMKMKCSCMESNTVSYERLPNIPPPVLELSHYSCSVGGEIEPEREELIFCNDDGSFQTVSVEKNLCTSDLCQLLALKNRVAKDANWSIIEHWIDSGLERSLEDHEDVLQVHLDMESYGSQVEKRMVFRKDFRKYEVFQNPEQYFPADMLDVNCLDETTEECFTLTPTTTLQSYFTSSEEWPPIFNYVWMKEADKQVWRKVFLLLKDKTLYYSHKGETIVKNLKYLKNRGSIESKDWAELCSSTDVQIVANLNEYNVYSTLNARSTFRAPTEFGLCLKPKVRGTLGFKCLACESDRARLCWLSAMRLAKYGKQLKENYKAFKNKQETTSPKEYNSYTVPNESVRSRVAMDFTGSVGRIVEDPKEAKAIAIGEGYSWKRRLRPSARYCAPVLHARGLESGVHITQAWFHSGMSRDQAARLVGRHGTADGVFLVRDSRSSPGTYVLTFKCGNKVLHTQIQPVMDPVRKTLCYSLDNGMTKFYDLLQLVEFYQLNTGCLPTRLTHYVVQSPTESIFSDRSAGIIPSSY